jgi:hypothetical protein
MEISDMWCDDQDRREVAARRIMPGILTPPETPPDVIVEECYICGDATGRAGRDEDSLFAGEIGPYCEDCWFDMPDEIGGEVVALRKQVATLKRKIAAQ